MIAFKNLFGVHAPEIKKTCVITPFLTKGLTRDLGVGDLARGRPFTTGQGEHFTFILSQIGSPLVGDCVLYLQETFCENVILLGACGLIEEKPGLALGSVVTPSRALALESFSCLVKGRLSDEEWAEADRPLLDQLKQSAQKAPPREVSCATLGSIKLETLYREFFKRNGVDVLEMECSAFFNAARHIRARAAGVFYVSDILEGRHVFEPSSEAYLQDMKKAQQTACRIIREFARSIV